MYILFTDETNTTANIEAGVKFFAYGGLIISEDKFIELHLGVKAIREKYGFSSGDEFKFDTRSRPSQVSISSFTAAKKEVLELCIQLECKFIAYVVLHEIARKLPLSKYVLWGADCVIGKFNYFLRQKDRYGLVMIDRLPNKNEYDYLAEKFSFGLVRSEGKNVELSRISLFGSTCNNASHASSVMDIVLGTFRYCINHPTNLTAAKGMMESVSKLIWADKRSDGNLDAFEKGLNFRPKKIKISKYKAEYDSLLLHINSLLS